MATDKDKLERAAELQKAIDAVARKKDDGNVDLGSERAAGGSGGQQLDKLLSGLHTKLDDCMKAMGSMSSRMDAIEGKHKKDSHRRKHNDDDAQLKDDETEEEREERLRREEEGREFGEPREVVADDLKRRHALADAQARADECAASWGQRADAPLAGESVRAYRCRQLRRYQRYSPQYSKADLDCITDEAVFGPIETQIYADACLAADSPDSVPAGTLRTVTKRMPSGHTEITFVGSPHAWMSQFAYGRSRFVTKIDPKASE